MSQKFYGNVKAGKLTLHNPAQLRAALLGMEGEVELDVAPRGHKRTDRANDRYWAILRAASASTGYTPEELHSACKVKFNTRTKEVLGQVYEFAGSTAAMESRQFTAYVDAVERWLREVGALGNDPVLR